MKFYFLLLIVFIGFSSCQEKKGEYVCTPCDLPCDKLFFEKPGECPQCKMTLIHKSELIDESTLKINEVSLSTGSGVFLIEGANAEMGKTIKVHYHKPKGFSEMSEVLMVIPGAGRNGGSYRDAWIEESEKHNTLILSPEFKEEKYPFQDYHLCGLIKNPNLRESISFKENSNIAELNEDLFTFQVNTNKNEWLFNDFDRIFDLVVASGITTQTGYDIFGHSAGGQILHRLAIFSKPTKAKKIIASNSGFYTLPDYETKIPFGLLGSNISHEDLKKSFSKELIILVGELDNENEKGGTLLRSLTVDKQGLHRLARAKHFFEFSQKQATSINTDFNWKMEIVPGVGHQHELMGDHAAKILFE